MRVTLDMPEDDLKFVRAALAVMYRDNPKAAPMVQNALETAAEQLDKQLYPRDYALGGGGFSAV